MIRLFAAVAALFCLAATAAAQSSITWENGFWVQKSATGLYRWEKAGGYGGRASWKWYPAAVKAAPTYTYNFYGSSQPYAAQGSTIYGQGAAASIPALDPNEFFANAASYQQDAQRNASKAYSEFSQTASQVFSQQADRAEQEGAAALLQAAALIVQATRGQTSTTLEKHYSGTSGAAVVPPGALGEIYAASCAGCHSPATAKEKGAGLDLSQWQTLSDEVLAKSFRLMRSGAMPKGGQKVPADLQLRALAQFDE